eukprot:TRINITY_DN3688_c0_g2_i1.p1 TRINITY_DN3688_c0_g2~~TRINITY_DN3688_c0_g2_i1.p1  ORF type:complete len:712 (+),score=187.67 TRINITY_DN3688_c0_g2_i1:52-2136(+)
MGSVLEPQSAPRAYPGSAPAGYYAAGAAAQGGYRSGLPGAAQYRTGDHPGAGGGCNGVVAGYPQAAAGGGGGHVLAAAGAPAHVQQQPQCSAPSGASACGASGAGGSGSTDPLNAHLIALLRHGSSLRRCVTSCFQAASGGRPALRLLELVQFRNALVRQVEVPEEALGNVHDEFVRFDFDGDGSLEEHEVYKLVKYHLREYLKQREPNLFHVHTPWGSLEYWGYTPVRELGKGAFGAVTLVADNSGNQRCVKAVPKDGACSQQLEEMKEEFAIMREMNDVHIAKTYHIFQDERSLFLVNEPYFGGSLGGAAVAATEAGVPVTEDWWRIIFAQCFEGLKHMHRSCMMHCDIKEENIMLKTTDYHRPDPVIIDYGLAQAFASERAQICGTPGYIPPETWKTQKWYPKGDCFSLGITMLQLVTHNVPDQKTGRMAFFVRGANSLPEVASLTQSRPAPLDLVPDQYREFKDLVWRLLRKDQGQRINAVQVFSHAWFAHAGSPSRATGEVAGVFAQQGRASLPVGAAGATAAAVASATAHAPSAHGLQAQLQPAPTSQQLRLPPVRAEVIGMRPVPPPAPARAAALAQQQQRHLPPAAAVAAPAPAPAVAAGIPQQQQLMASAPRSKPVLSPPEVMALLEQLAARSSCSSAPASPMPSQQQQRRQLVARPSFQGHQVPAAYTAPDLRGFPSPAAYAVA